MICLILKVYRLIFSHNVFKPEFDRLGFLYNDDQLDFRKIHLPGHFHNGL